MRAKVFKFLKKKSVIALLAMTASGGIYATSINGPVEPVRYVLAAAEQGSLVVAVQTSGQVTDQNQLEIKPGASGEILKVLVKDGDQVKTGDALFQIDSKDAAKTVRNAVQSVADARLALESAQISLDKLKGPPDSIQLLQAQNSVNQAQRNLDELLAGPDATAVKQAEADLALKQNAIKMSADGVTPQVVQDAYDANAATIKNAAQTAGQAILDADTILGIDNKWTNDTYEKLLSALDSGKLWEANALYPAAKTAAVGLKTRADNLKTLGESAANIEAAQNEAETTMKLMEPLLQKTYDVLLNTVTAYNFTQSSLNSLQSTIRSDQTSVSSRLTALTSARQAVDQAKTNYTTSLLNAEKAQTALDELKAGADAQDIAAAREKLAEVKESLAELQTGADDFEIRTAQNTVAQRRAGLAAAQNNLADAQEAFRDCTVRAPFDGVIARIQVQPTNQASASTVLATLLTNAKIAQVSLNEVDAAKIKAGQKVTLTFDAITDLEIAGEVFEIDPLGTVAQGVVNYEAAITFNTQDDRIKTGMSVSAAIVTDFKAGALLIPNSAVQQGASGATVQVLNGIELTSEVTSQGIASATEPEIKTVQIGLANDQQTEITEGLVAGDQVVVRTIDPSTAAKTTTQTSSQRSGMGSFGGAMMRPD